MRAGIWEGARCGRIRFNVLAATIGVIAFYWTRPNQSHQNGRENPHVAREEEVVGAAIKRNEPDAYQLSLDEVLSMFRSGGKFSALATRSK